MRSRAADLAKRSSVMRALPHLGRAGDARRQGWSASSPTATCASSATRPAGLERDDASEQLVTVRARRHARARRRSCCTSTASRSCWWSTSDGRLRGLITIKDIEKTDAVSRTPPRTSSAACACGAAVGVGPDRLERAQALVDAGVDVIVRRHRARPLDERARDGRASCKRTLPDARRWSAATSPPAEGAEALIKAGARRRQGRHRARLDLHHARRRRRRRAAAHRGDRRRRRSRSAAASR